MLRTHAELGPIAAANPFGDTSGVHVVFLDRAPVAERGRATRSRSLARATRFAVAGREIYLQPAERRRADEADARLLRAAARRRRARSATGTRCSS